MSEDKPEKIIVADPDPSISETLREFLVHIGYRAEPAESRDEVMAKVAEGEYGVVIIVHLFNAYGETDIVEQLKSVNPEICTIILVSYPLVEYVLTAFRKGAFDVIIKPVDLFELRETIERAIRQHKLNMAYRQALKNAGDTARIPQSLAASVEP